MSEAKAATVKFGVVKSLATADLNVLSADGKPSGWIVTFAGPAHEKVKALNDEIAAAALRKSAAMEKAQVNGKKWTPKELTPDENRREGVSFIVKRIVDWTPVDLGDGQGPREFDAESAIDLFVENTDLARDVFPQFVEFVTAEKSFLPASAKA